MDEVLHLMDKFPWLIFHDNVNIPFHVFSQWLDNQGEFGNGTAATIYIKHSATPLSSTANQDLQENHAAGLKNPLMTLDILDLANESYPHIHTHVKYHVLQFLLDAPAFNFSTYKH